MVSAGQRSSCRYLGASGQGGCAASHRKGDLTQTCSNPAAAGEGVEVGIVVLTESVVLSVKEVLGDLKDASSTPPSLPLETSLDCLSKHTSAAKSEPLRTDPDLSRHVREKMNTSSY